MRLLIYGVTGYAGGLIASAAAAAGLDPILAGRDGAATARVARACGLTSRTFGLDDDARVRKALADVSVVLNCAGPFARTARRLAEHCLRVEADYLDIAGEVPEFDALYELDAQARAAGRMLMPGVGMGVVPTDCLALYLKQRLPTATKLVLAFATEGGVSRGTLGTVLSGVHRAGSVRRHGRLVMERPGLRARRIDFGNGVQTAVSNPWRADLTSAFLSTGIPDIETLTVFPAALRVLMGAGGYIGGALGGTAIQGLLSRLIALAPVGPSQDERTRGRTRIWGEVTDAAGQVRAARIEGPDAYDFTVATALAVAHEALIGNAPAGFQTPAQAYGDAFVLRVDGVTRTDIA